MRKIIQKILAILARRIVQKHKPKVVGITGSVGKTSVRLAIACVLSQEFHVRSSAKNFNNEFGLPLTIIGMTSPGRNPFLWLVVFAKAFVQAFFPVQYPDVLVLEMGIDHKGDMDYLLSIVQPDVAIITSIGSSHLANFESLHELEIEKGKLADGVKSGGVLVLNADDLIALRQDKKTKARVLTYGYKHEANIQAVSVKETLNPEVMTAVDCTTGQGRIHYNLHAVGRTHLLASCAACAVGLITGMNYEKIAEGLAKYRPMPGRLNILPGIHGSVLVEDSYNAAPDSVKEALRFLSALHVGKRVAVLGDMLELGETSEPAHKMIGEEIAKMGIDLLVTVGELSKDMAESARLSGMSPETARSFKEIYSAVDFLQKIVDSNTAVLVKGSQGMRMEKVSRELLLNPDSAIEVLPRQYGKWLES